MKILRAFRSIPEAIERLTLTLQVLAELHQGQAPAEARLDDLERSRSLWEAKIEAEILKAESSYKSASNAEARARTMVKAYEKQLDPFGEDGDELEEAVPQGDEPAGEEERLQLMPVGMAAPVGKTNALRSKFMM